MHCTHRALAAPTTLVLATLLALTPRAADAAPGPWTGAEGKNTSKSELIVRALPTTFSAREGSLLPGEVFPIVCKVAGTVVRRGDEANNLWYRLPGSTRAWVSALYVRNVDKVPAYCGDGKRYDGRVATATLVRREAPTTRANAHGALSRGAEVRIICKLQGQAVDGNRLWYNLPQGLWVAARYVANIGSPPPYCTR
jgi:hypothetical protein